MDGTLENSKTKNVSTCSIGSVATTDNNSVASDGGMSVSWEGTGALEASGVTGALEALGCWERWDVGNVGMLDFRNSCQLRSVFKFGPF